MSTSQLHYSFKRLEAARLIGPDRAVRKKALLELLLHGVKYVFAASPGSETLGIPTGIVPSLFPAVDRRAGAPLVWPTPTGDTRGPSIEPLSKFAINAVRDDRELYRLLAAVDAMRVGGARDISVATEFLTQALTR